MLQFIYFGFSIYVRIGKAKEARKSDRQMDQLTEWREQIGYQSVPLLHLFGSRARLPSYLSSPFADTTSSTNLVTVSIITPITPLFRIQLDKRINAHDSHTSLDRRLQLFNLTHARLQRSSLDTIMHFTLRQVQSIVLVVLLFGKMFDLVWRKGLRGRGMWVCGL